MGLESATFIDDLVDTNPASTDLKRQGDDHLRLIKETLQATFPNADKAFYFPTSVAKTADFTVLAAEMGKTFLVSTAGGVVTATLPSLSADDDGWQCHFIKTNTATTAFFIAPNSGTLQSGEVTGLAKCRRVIPGHRCTALWTGAGWYISRVPNVPIGSCIEFHGTALPVGYEWPTGQTLSSASTNYPEFYSVNGSSGVTLDRQERVAAMADITTVSRLTDASGGVGGVFGDTGGVDTHTLTEAQLASHSHTINVTDSHYHVVFGADANGTGLAPTSAQYVNQILTSGSSTFNYALVASTSAASIGRSSETAGGSITAASVAAGSGSAHNNVQPTIITNFILVVE